MIDITKHDFWAELSELEDLEEWLSENLHETRSQAGMSAHCGGWRDDAVTWAMDEAGAPIAASLAEVRGQIAALRLQLKNF